MATATEAREYDKRVGRTLSRVIGGYIASRTFRVDTDDPIDIYTASGMPAIGDQYPGFPTGGFDCRAYQIQPEVPKGGGPGPSGSGTNTGLTYVRVDYRTAGIGFGPGPNQEPFDPQPGDSYTVETTTAGSIEINTAISGDPIKPVQRQVTGISLVTRVYKSAATAYLPEVVRIRDSTNSASVTVPNFMGVGTSTGILFAANTLLFSGHRKEIVRPGLIAVDYEFLAAPPGTGPGQGHVYYYQEEDENGVPIASFGPEVIYPSLAWDTADLFGVS